ncbi:hypothetical protein HDV01_004844 [Terramyces sp. JEL0728]|nr:hypothetical protein HDV01_004844 [Terramyces sp. JEL0728]
MTNVTLDWNNLLSTNPQLTFLRIPGNGLLGDFDPQLPALQYLDAGFNNFTGSIKPDISNMPNLQYLGLEYTQVAGSLPDTLAKLPLSSIDLANTGVSGQIPDLSALSNLDYCNLGNACSSDQSLVPSQFVNGPPSASISAFTIVIVAVGIALVAVGVGLLVLKKRKGGFVERPWTLHNEEDEERQPITMVEVDDAFELRHVKPLE